MRLYARIAPLAFALASCGGGQTRGTPFDPSWTDDHGAAVTAFARAFHAVKVPAGADVAVGVIGKRALTGAPLDGSPKWRFDHELHGRPAIAGSVVVAAGGGELFALDARTGRLLWSRASAARIRGAGDDGATTVVSLIPVTGLGSLVLAIGRDGSVIRQIEADAVIGVPAVVGDSVFLPWQGRFLSIYDLPSGDERARVDLRGDTSRAFALGGAIFTGERSATRFDEHVARAATTARLPPPMGGLPGDPAWMRPGGEWVNREADALDKVRLHARPKVTGPAAIAGDRFAATFYRAALGFEAKGGALAWARAHDADFLGGAAYAGGFALCDAKGEVVFLDAETGARVGALSIGERVDACLVQADAFTRAPAREPARPLLAQIEEVLRVADPSLTAVQQVLLRELAKAEGDEATRVMIELASDDRAAPPLRTDAGALLAARRSGAAVMLKALAVRRDPAAGAKPPVGPLADALAALGEVRAAPLLAVHLSDVRTPSDDRRRAAAALVKLAGAAEAPALEAFFTQHRAASVPEADASIQAATLFAAEALIRLGVHDPIAAAIADPRTRPALKEKLVAIFTPRAATGAARAKGQ